MGRAKPNSGSRARFPTRTVFITGTDTGVGKTVLTALLLQHLRSGGWRAAAMKPWCSGGRADAELLHALHDGMLTLAEVNPYHFRPPVAPLVAARRAGRTVSLAEVLRSIAAVRRELLSTPQPTRVKGRRGRSPSCGCLLIEGCGGLLAPLGDGYTLLDVIETLGGEVIVVAANRLGTINHTLLSIRALHNAGLQSTALKVVLMNHHRRDASCASNASLLSELLAPIALFNIPFLGQRCATAPAIKRAASTLSHTLALIDAVRG
ncbi:ATP-dependent dethiobiotin synthetase BioD (modular protein) [Verrucomicrobia bacterium]|nr:ATP-dependent dethiobiotin synthetase BioD (modular protein) [Verrucomicrobiota bacterium]